MTDGTPVGSGTVRVRAEGAVRVVVLDRPERLNAITPELVDDLLAALRGCHADPGAGAVVLTGAGSSFCAGDDLTDVERQASSREAVTSYVEALQDVTRELVRGRLPVVAAVRGWAVGGGLEWVADCDLVVMGDTARGFFPEMSLGLFVTGGVTALLPRIVGLSRARRLLLLGERFTAEEAEEWGLAHRVVPDDEVLPVATEWAARLAALPPGPVLALRDALTDVAVGRLDDALARETVETVRGFLDPQTAGRADAALRRGR